jgi:hypothetical protein
MKFTREELKGEARLLRAHFANKHRMELSIGQSLEAIAAIRNYPNWDAAVAAVRGDTEIAGNMEKEARIAVSASDTSEHIYRQVCQQMRSAPDHFLFMVDENDDRSTTDWERITDVISQCEIGFSRQYV